MKDYYLGEFPENDWWYAAIMRRLANHPAANKVAAGLEAVSFN
jgi:hypothetical protein